MALGQDTASFPCSPAEKQRELARKGSLKNGSMGSPVNQQPKKNNVMARTRYRPLPCLDPASHHLSLLVWSLHLPLPSQAQLLSERRV